MQNEIILDELNDGTLLELGELVDRPAKLNEDGTVRKEATQGILRISRATWYAGIAAGRYPKPIKLGKQKRVWRAGDIKALINSQKQA